MAEEKDKWVEAVGKLIKLTQEGIIRWKSDNFIPAQLKKNTDDRIEIVFKTIYKKRLLRIYRREYKEIRNDDIFEKISVSRKEPGEYWNKVTNLEFIDDIGFPLWTFPEISILDDLYSSVKYQVAGVKEFLDEILKDDS